MKKFGDPFLLLILTALALGFFIPVTGQGADVFDWITKGAIFLLFFGYGARLSAAQAWEGVKHWKLHITILAFTFVVFPILGIGILALTNIGLAQTVALGLVFLCIVPSTVQSSITFTSIAGGNIAGAMVSATASNVLGVALTPLLAALLLPSVGGQPITWGSVGSIFLQLLLPFILGQLSRPLTANFMTTYKKRLKYLDQGVICLVVYGAFSAFSSSGTWREVSLTDLLAMTGIGLALLALMLWLTWWLSGKLHFNRADRIAIMMCGTKKSLATGVPIASVMFPAATVGLIVLPLMIFHQAQLMTCSIIAGRMARQNTEDDGSAA